VFAAVGQAQIALLTLPPVSVHTGTVAFVLQMPPANTVAVPHLQLRVVAAVPSSFAQFTVTAFVTMVTSVLATNTQAVNLASNCFPHSVASNLSPRLAKVTPVHLASLADERDTHLAAEAK